MINIVLPEKERINMYKGNTLDELTSAMREKMIADNFILMSHHFHSRIGKLIKYMQSQNHCFCHWRSLSKHHTLVAGGGLISNL